MSQERERCTVILDGWRCSYRAIELLNHQWLCSNHADIILCRKVCPTCHGASRAGGDECPECGLYCPTCRGPYRPCKHPSRLNPCWYCKVPEAARTEYMKTLINKFGGSLKYNDIPGLFRDYWTPKNFL